MNEADALIKVSERGGKPTVDARDLHEWLEVKRDFSNWIKGRIIKYGFVESVDYTVCTDRIVANFGDYSEGGEFSPNLAKTHRSANLLTHEAEFSPNLGKTHRSSDSEPVATQTTALACLDFDLQNQPESLVTHETEFFPNLGKTHPGGRPRVNYALGIGMCKELCMVENSERGRQARRYFIRVEEQYAARRERLSDGRARRRPPSTAEIIKLVRVKVISVREARTLLRRSGIIGNAAPDAPDKLPQNAAKLRADEEIERFWQERIAVTGKRTDAIPTFAAYESYLRHTSEPPASRYKFTHSLRRLFPEIVKEHVYIARRKKTERSFVGVCFRDAAEDRTWI